MRTLLLSLFLLGLCGCPTTSDDDDVASECPVEDRFTSDPDLACVENFCGEPEVWPATGGSDATFRTLQDGDTVLVHFGIQGGYHIDMAARTTNLCPVIFLDFELYDISSGDEVLIHNVRRHVQSIRENLDPDVPSTQRWWVEQFRFPCSWWPDDPNNDPTCPDEPVGRIDEVPLRLRVQAEDHNENRRSISSVDITAECCGE